MPATVDTDIARLRELLRQTADEHREPVLLVIRPDPKQTFADPLPYGVRESVASEWERAAGEVIRPTATNQKG